MLEYSKKIEEMNDEEILAWARAEQGSLADALSWAGWGFPYSKTPQVEADWYATRDRIAAARDEARKRGLI